MKLLAFILEQPSYVDKVRILQGFDCIPIIILNIWTHDSEQYLS